METNETGRAAAAAATRSYENPLACSRCYAQHLAKAKELWSEWLEDETRYSELADCIGNIGCAEDHAVALGRENDRRRLHDIREKIYNDPASVGAELQAVSSAAVRFAMQTAKNERQRIVQELEALRKNALESQRGPGVENTAEPARTEEH